MRQNAFRVSSTQPYQNSVTMTANATFVGRIIQDLEAIARDHHLCSECHALTRDLANRRRKERRKRQKAIRRIFHPNVATSTIKVNVKPLKEHKNGRKRTRTQS